MRYKLLKRKNTMSIDIRHGMPEEKFVKVYVERVSDSLSLEGIYPDERREEIEATRNVETKMHKLSAWRLLTKALFDLGVDIKNIPIYKSECGKWLCDGFYFSISHSKDLVCVAISSENVGIDIQSKDKDYGDNFAKRILSKPEFEEYGNLSSDEKIKYIDAAWCKKESIMKTLGAKAFFPQEIEIKDHDLYFTSLMHNSVLYYLSVCTSLAGNVEIIGVR